MISMLQHVARVSDGAGVDEEFECVFYYWHCVIVNDHMLVDNFESQSYAAGRYLASFPLTFKHKSYTL